MKTDSHFMLGSLHEGDGMPCQDYARSMVVDGAAFAIVSDGCSTGGGETDNGSRIVTHAAAQSLRRHWATIGNPHAGGTVQQIALEQRIVMSSGRILLGLTQADLFATSLYAYYTVNGGFAHIQGDGVVCWVRQEDGTLVMVRFEWLRPDESHAPAPFYPIYYEDDYKTFRDYYGGDPNRVVLRSETWEWHPDSAEPVLVDTKDYTLSEGIDGPVLMLAPGLSCVAVFTDGVTQVEGLDWKDAARQLLAFKTTAGVFVKRRMGRFYRQAKKLGRGAMDDLSGAVILDDNYGGAEET